MDEDDHQAKLDQAALDAARARLTPDQLTRLDRLVDLRLRQEGIYAPKFETKYANVLYEVRPYIRERTDLDAIDTEAKNEDSERKAQAEHKAKSAAKVVAEASDPEAMTPDNKALTEASVSASPPLQTAAPQISDPASNPPSPHTETPSALPPALAPEIAGTEPQPQWMAAWKEEALKDRDKPPQGRYDMLKDFVQPDTVKEVQQEWAAAAHEVTRGRSL